MNLWGTPLENCPGKPWAGRGQPEDTCTDAWERCQRRNFWVEPETETRGPVISLGSDSRMRGYGSEDLRQPRERSQHRCTDEQGGLSTSGSGLLLAYLKGQEVEVCVFQFPLTTGW